MGGVVMWSRKLRMGLHLRQWLLTCHFHSILCLLHGVEPCLRSMAQLKLHQSPCFVVTACLPNPCQNQHASSHARLRIRPKKANTSKNKHEGPKATKKCKSWPCILHTLGFRWGLGKRNSCLLRPHLSHSLNSQYPP